MLVKRKNGAYMANQKGEKHGLGKYADIELMDKGKTNIAIIADSVFSAASAATSTYYLKNIDDKLEELQETLNEILAERKLDKQSRILGDLEMLEQIMLFASLAFAVMATKYEKVNGIVDYAEATVSGKYAYIVGWFMQKVRRSYILPYE